MARRIKELEPEPTVVLIPDRYTITMDDWLASLRSAEPISLAASGAELVAEARSENE